jgi:hypothetical protein
MRYLGLLLAIISLSCYSQQSSTDPFVGVWRGTSICQVKNSPCNSETVVYYISAGTSKNLYVMKANKIVNGQEEEMGIIDFTYNETLKTLTNKSVDHSNRQGIWAFELKDGFLKGTLTVDGALYRIIDVKKDK